MHCSLSQQTRRFLQLGYVTVPDKERSACDVTLEVTAAFVCDALLVL